MKIFTNSGAIDRGQMYKKIAPLSARKELEDNIRHEKSNMKNSSIQDRDQAKKSLDGWQKTMDNSCPENLSPSAKNVMWKRAKQLKDEFSIGMLSRDELHPVKMMEKNGVVMTLADREKMKSINSVDRQRAWDKKNKDKVREYKNIMRHLVPDNPNATDIEKFRPSFRTG